MCRRLESHLLARPVELGFCFHRRPADHKHGDAAAGALLVDRQGSVADLSEQDEIGLVGADFLEG